MEVYEFFTGHSSIGDLNHPSCSAKIDEEHENIFAVIL